MIELIRVDVLKLRKRRGLFWWSLILTAGSMLAFFGVKVTSHLVDATGNGPAGGKLSYDRGLDLLCVTAVVAAALIGTAAGGGDRGAGVLRDLVATGRSRVSLFLARVPAALALIVPMTAGAFVIATAACFAFASGLATPSAAQVAWYGAFILASAVLACTFGLVLAELIGSRGIAVGVLLGWFLAGEQLILSLTSLGDARDGLASVAVDRLRPLVVEGDSRDLDVSLATALAVLAAWLVVPTVAAMLRASARDV